MMTVPKISVVSRARRTLRNTSRFKLMPEGSVEPIPQTDEYGEIIGVYENPPGVEPQRIVVTEQAIGCFGAAVARWIAYDDVKMCQGPREKLVDDTITIVLKSGIQTKLRIAGGDDRFKDVFEFVRFIDRVIEDRRPAS